MFGPSAQAIKKWDETEAELASERSGQACLGRGMSLTSSQAVYHALSPGPITPAHMITRSEQIRRLVAQHEGPGALGSSIGS